jgi:hypothetical protein
MKTIRIFTLLVFALPFIAVVDAQDGIQEVSRLYNLWHYADGVAAQGDYVYVSCGVSGLQVVNVSDRDNIEVAGALEMPFPAYDVAVAGDIAYVACHDADALIRIIDISEPENPMQIGAIDSLGYWDYEDALELKIAVEGDYFFVLASTYIYIFNVSNPADPQPINHIDVGFLSKNGFEISEHYLYILPFRFHGEDDYLIRGYDVSDPENPEEAGVFHYDDEIKGIAVSGNYAFATADSGFLVIDVSDVAEMQFVTFLDLNDRTGSHIFLTDNFACVYARHNIYLIDISNPTQPDVCGVIEGLEQSYDIAATDDMVYVTDRNNRLKIFDVTDISEPQEIWSYPPPGHILDVALRGNHAFLAAGSAGLKAVDIADPEHPVEVGSCALPGEASSITLDRDYAYVATGDEGLRILNISDPENPFEAGDYDSASVHDVAIKDNFAYLTGQRFYFSVLDISDPAEPALVDTCWLGWNSSWNVAVAGNHLYMTDGRWADWNIEYGNLNIYDITTPDEPRPVGQLETEHLLKTVVVEDNIAYVYYLEDIGGQGPESAGVLVLDVSESSDPLILAEYELAEYFGGMDMDYNEDMEIIGDLLIVANSFKGLHLIDVSNPEDPREIEHYLTLGLASGVALFDHYACVADYSNFGIYDCSEHFGIPIDEADVPKFHLLLNAYPNPFNAMITIEYLLPVRSYISMTVFDIKGREVATLINDAVEAGYHQAIWKGHNAPSGIYICRIEGGSFEQTLKMTLIK